MARIIRLEDLKKVQEKYVHPYMRYVNFHLLVIVIAFVMWCFAILMMTSHYLGLRSWILSFFLSYCTLKYVFTFIREVDKRFHTNVTDMIEDNATFYEGSFIADLQKQAFSWDFICSTINITATLLLPHFQSIMNLSFADLVSGVLEAVRNQVISSVAIDCIEAHRVSR